MPSLFNRIHEKDILWTERYLSRTMFFSGYWCRRRLDGAVSSCSHLAHGLLLDLGCGVKPYEPIFKQKVERYIGMEYSPESGYRGNKADMYGDAAAIPLDSGSIDTVLCTEVLEHVPDPDKVVSEIARVLRPGGVVICTAPFVYPIHDAYDFFRYAPKGVAAMMERHGLRVDRVVPLSGTGVTMAIMFNLYLYDVGFIWTKWLYPIGLVLRPVLLAMCFLTNILGWVFEKLIPSEHLSFNHLTIARKSAHERNGES